MTRDEAKTFIISRGAELLRPDRSGKGYVCPICYDGDGVHGNNGITTKDGTHFTCWRGCFTNADIIDIIGQRDGLTDFPSKLEAAARELNVTIDSGKRAAPGNLGKEKRPTAERTTQPILHNTQYTIHNDEAADGKAPKQDFTDFLLKAHKHIKDTDYLTRRGISQATIDRFKLGYVSNYNAHNPRAKGWNALIIPTSKYGYVIRNTDPNADKGNRYVKWGETHFFNEEQLQTADKPLIIVEGEIDALSIIEAGGEAIALGSTSGANSFMRLAEKKKPLHSLVIALDNDEAGEAETKKMTKRLDELKIPYILQNLYGECKDANEALTADRTALEAAITDVYGRANAEEEAALEAEREQLKKESVMYSLRKFLDDVERSKWAKPTGFPAIDKMLAGGFYAGLYIVGAISALGKTTFCLQIADQIAASGHDVLIFSLEMATNELIAKSVSRLTLIKDIAENGTTIHAKNTREVMTGKFYEKYSQEEKQLIFNSVAAYGNIAEHIYIKEGVGNIGVDEVRERVKKHIRITGKPPVVIIDYLQILAPADMRATDKQNTDKAVLELKRMSRDYDIPIIGISSFNRENYTSPVNRASFKETGAIEYSSDVLIGLQYEGMDYRKGEKDQARAARIRELIDRELENGKEGEYQTIQVKILKNRNGYQGDTRLYFYPRYNYFTERPVSGATPADNTGDETEWTPMKPTARTKRRKTSEAKEAPLQSMAELDEIDPDTLKF